MPTNGFRRQQQPRNDCCYISGPFWVTLFIFLIMLVFMSLVDYYAYLQRVRNPELHVLPDLLLDTLPQVRNNWIAHGITYAFIGLVALVVLAHPRRLFFGRRLMLQWSILLFLRCTLVLVTHYPDPNPTCAGNDPLPDLVRQTALGYSCGDMMFSGHTTALLTAVLTLWDIFPWRERWWHVLIHALSVSGAVAGMMMILVVRLHYTADVLVAIYLGFLIRWGLHSYLDHPSKEDKRLGWFEMDRRQSGCNCSLSEHESEQETENEKRPLTGTFDSTFEG